MGKTKVQPSINIATDPYFDRKDGKYSLCMLTVGRRTTPCILKGKKADKYVTCLSRVIAVETLSSTRRSMSGLE
jgi:hypothetical protein